MRVSALEGYRLWADSYETAPNPLLALESRVLPGVLGPVEGKRVVDVACGTGRWAARLTARGATVAGVDFCAEMLGRAPGEVRGRLAVAEAGRLPVATGTADLTISTLAVGYFPDIDGAMAEMARVTRRNGRVAISELHPDAVAAGWTRSFRAHGERREIEHFAWPLERIAGAAAKAGLELEFELHERLGEPERGIFTAAGKAEAFAEVRCVTALWIGSWRRA